jgi:hypothetical protein
VNSNPYAVPAIVLSAVMIIACILGLVWVSYAQRPASGKHARHPAPEPVPFADPADVTDPDGDSFVGQITAPDRDWWDQEPPPSRVEVLTGPAARIAQTSALTMNVLARVRDGLAALDVGGGDPAIDDTGQLPAAVCIWGKTAPELADELAARYLT